MNTIIISVIFILINSALTLPVIIAYFKEKNNYEKGDLIFIGALMFAVSAYICGIIYKAIL